MAYGTYEFPHDRNWDSDLREIIEMYLKVQGLPGEWTSYQDMLNTDWSNYQQNLNAQWTAYKELMDGNFTNLQNFVNNYFDNLNVQQEINEKLNQMAASGELVNIFSSVFGSSLPIFVDNTTQMSNQTKAYVLLTNGHLYTWNGTEFADTGYVYGAPSNVLKDNGKFLSSDGDLNNATASGWYRIYDGKDKYPAHSPLNEGDITVIVLSPSYSTEYVTQIAIYAHSKSVFYRIFNKNNGTELLAWTIVYTDGTLQQGLTQNNVLLLRTTLPATTDLNNLTASGWYRSYGSAPPINSPNTNSTLAIFHIMPIFSTTTFLQIAIYSNGDILYRIYNKTASAPIVDWTPIYTNTTLASGLANKNAFFLRTTINRDTDLNLLTGTGLFRMYEGGNIGPINGPIKGKGNLAIFNFNPIMSGSTLGQLVIYATGEIFYRIWNTANNTPFIDWTPIYTPISINPLRYIALGDSRTKSGNILVSYPDTIESIKHYKVVDNQGVSGMRMGTYNDGTTYSNAQDVVTKINFGNYDIVTINYGFNDFASQAPIGTVDDTGWDTMCGALYNILKYIYTSNPNIYVVVFTPIPSLVTRTIPFTEYENAIINVCNKYSIQCYNLRKEAVPTMIYDTFFYDNVHSYNYKIIGEYIATKLP